MKKFVSKYSQQLVMAALFVVIAGGIASASWPITAGFVRNLYSGYGRFSYGYGFGIGNAPGYGYGYDLQDRINNSPFDYAEYGFVGTDGSATIDDVATTQTTATITYSTSYLAKMDAGYSLSNPPTAFNAIGIIHDNDFNSGTRIWNITDLICGTTYYYVLLSHDAGGLNHPTYSSFVTSACDSNSASTTTVVTTGSHGRPQSFGTNPAGTPSGDQPQFPESPRLEYSDFGPGPHLLQVLLNHLGFIVSNRGAGAPGSETEFFGPKTRAALKKFQKAHGLNPDGIYGPETKAAMEKELNK